MAKEKTQTNEPTPEYTYNVARVDPDNVEGAPTPEDIEHLQTEPEEMPDLDDLAQEPSQGAWPAGWYKAEILGGYETRNGKQVVTEDTVSQKGDSHNVTLALKVAKGEDFRTMRAGFNYRVDDFDPDVLAGIKEAREEYKGIKGKWPGDAADLQRSSLAVAKIGQFQKAIGFKFKRDHEGALDPSVFIGQNVDVRLRITEDGFNDPVEFAKAGERTSGGRRTRK